MITKDKTHTYSRKQEARILFTLIMGLLMGMLCTVITSSSVSAAQTKNQCQRCCDNKYEDEYYAERCRLECHRDPDHCKGHQEAPKKKQKPEVKKKRKKPKRATRRKPKKKKKTVTLRFPNPLNIIPGEEWRTAVELVVLNGITSRHPKFVQAVEQVERILISFRVNNPQGGELPTEALERVIVKYK